MRQSAGARAGVDVHEALLRMVAHFGWPAAWAPLLGHVAKQQPLGRGWANRTPIPQTNVLQAAMCLGESRSLAALALMHLLSFF